MQAIQPDAPLNRSAYLVLGMISAGFTTGYDISKNAELCSRFFWAAGDGQVYPQLKKLAAAGLIESEPAPRGGRARNVYALTGAGEEALRAWLLSDAQPMFELRDEGLLQIFFSGGITVRELRQRVEIVTRLHADTRARLLELEPMARTLPVTLLTLKNGLAVHEAAERWGEETMQLLDGLDPDAQADDALRDRL